MLVSAAPPIPVYISAATSGPASALATGEIGLSAPNTSTDSGAVAASAPKPAAIAPDTGGGSQRRSVNSQTGATTASPAIARYDSWNDSECALAGRQTATSTKAIARIARGFWGRSVAIAALEIQNIATERSTDGEAPTMKR